MKEPVGVRLRCSDELPRIHSRTAINVNNRRISVLPVPRFSRPIGRFFRLIGRAIFGGRGLRFFGRFRKFPRVLGYRGFEGESMVS